MKNFKEYSKLPKIEVRFENENLTRYGFFPPIAKFFLDYLKLRKRFKVISLKKIRDRDFSIIDLCVSIISLPILGIERISHVNDMLCEETVVAKILGLKRIFDQSTLHRFLNLFQGWHINQLEKIHNGLLKDYGQSLKEGYIITDIDMSTHSVEGTKREGATPGKNTKAKGNDCYQWSTAFSNGELIAQQLDNGYVHCKSHLDILYQKAKNLLGHIDLLRIDGGYFSGKDINFLLDKKQKFITKCKANLVSVKEQLKNPPKIWVPYDENTWLLDCGQVQILPDVKEPLRLIIVHHRNKRKRVKHGRIYYETKDIYSWLITNLQKKHNTKRLFKIYSKRQTIENFFKECNQSFNSGKLPSQLFRANQAYLYFIGIAYNIMIWFKRGLYLPDYKGLC